MVVERKSRLTEHLMSIEKIRDDKGQPVPKPGTQEELFWLMEKACVWMCDEMDRLEEKLTSPKLEI